MIVINYGVIELSRIQINIKKCFFSKILKEVELLVRYWYANDSITNIVTTEC
ncbi:hypothetical protein O5404_07675 (plasmid) [Borrelia miyamotoi]|uniref:Uncharacterized protein n=1 Tax=Borrelia miyamotoi TaxID=47466 RepID=A0AAX3JQ67_9SPIR|nr:hypothetical protein [Borrelia miyamotoi]WAZ72884.1 hypothetical protein O5404_07675 [Borrelia miyamotoi]WVI05714.1 hypothetical protein F9Y91_02545 [Borrelia miyamotoi]